ncbi:hypothetical protein [Alkalihalobacterium alkalinitrilicum]|uniref:hypothetical protein n=1 Tax=Alkalihalobacterium alkalinitrilicum TaxID=427920 RepID=UPI0009954BFC|nr:hypothetical protein [Alkalihalobacterium alkalinitrilicum]
MGIKVSTIELKEIDVIQLEDGTFEKRFINVKKYPAFLTNRALATGRNMGITKTSLITELILIQGLLGPEDDIDTENLTTEQAEAIDFSRYLPVIYLGIIGANKKLDLSYDDFLDQYHGDFEETLNDYIALVEPYISQNPNEFKKGLEQSTKKKRKKAKRK